MAVLWWFYGGFNINFARLACGSFFMMNFNQLVAIFIVNSSIKNTTNNHHIYKTTHGTDTKALSWVEPAFVPSWVTL